VRKSSEHAHTNTVKSFPEIALGMQQGQEPHVFSMASWKQCQFNERLLDVFMENLALDPTWVKNHSCYEKLRAYGAIAA
jgi:hypothetical protein